MQHIIKDNLETLLFLGYQCDQRIDYCKNITCHYGGQCINNLGYYQCQCRSGYNGTTCENTPCTWRPCLHNGTCIINDNAIGGFKCDCHTAVGYNGVLCENGMLYNVLPFVISSVYLFHICLLVSSLVWLSLCLLCLLVVCPFSNVLVFVIVFYCIVFALNQNRQHEKCFLTAIIFFRY